MERNKVTNGHFFGRAAALSACVLVTACNDHTTFIGVDSGAGGSSAGGKSSAGGAKSSSGGLMGHLRDSGSDATGSGGTLVDTDAGAGGKRSIRDSGLDSGDASRGDAASGGGASGN